MSFFFGCEGVFPNNYIYRINGFVIQHKPPIRKSAKSSQPGNILSFVCPSMPVCTSESAYLSSSHTSCACVRRSLAELIQILNFHCHLEAADGNVGTFGDIFMQEILITAFHIAIVGGYNSLCYCFFTCHIECYTD